MAGRLLRNHVKVSGPSQFELRRARTRPFVCVSQKSSQRLTSGSKPTGADGGGTPDSVRAHVARAGRRGGGDVIGNLLSYEDWLVSCLDVWSQLGVAAVLSTADLFRNQFGPVCVTDFGPRAGFASGRLLTLFLRNAKVGAACGVSLDCQNQPAKRAGRVLRNRIDLGAVDDRLRDSAHGESSFHVALYQLNAYDVHIEDTRRAACGGSLLRGFFRVYAQKPRAGAHAAEVATEASAPGTREDNTQSGDAQMTKD